MPKCDRCWYWDGENCTAYTIQELIDMDQKCIDCQGPVGSPDCIGLD